METFVGTDMMQHYPGKSMPVHHPTVGKPETTKETDCLNNSISDK